MSNRVSPAPSSSPLPPGDLPSPDDLIKQQNNFRATSPENQREETAETIPLNTPPQSPPPDPYEREYTPNLGVHVQDSEIEQASYVLPGDDKNDPTLRIDNDDNHVNPDNSSYPIQEDNSSYSALTTSTNLDDPSSQQQQLESTSSDTNKPYEIEQQENSDINAPNRHNDRPHNSLDSDRNKADENLFTTSAAADAEAHATAGTTFNDDGSDNGGSVRQRVVVGRLPPLDDSPRRGGGEEGSNPPLAQPVHWSRDNQQIQQQQQQQRQQRQQRQAFGMSSRPDSGITRKERDDEVIGANDSRAESGCCAIVLTILSYIAIVLFLPFSLCLTIKVVQEYERAVIFRLGRLLPGGAKGPGIFFVMPCVEEYTKVDLRTVSFDVPPQEVLTRDSVTVSVDAVVYYRISNPTVSVANVENAANSTQLLAQTTLRNVLGTQNLAEILSNREHISEQMQIVLDGATDKWGIKVERVEIKDVRLPTQLQRAMATEAEAARDARAKVIAAEGEQKASLALKEAADIIVDSPAAMQLRYLQTLNSISAEKNSTIIFPLPIELIASMIKK